MILDTGSSSTSLRRLNLRGNSETMSATGFIPPQSSAKSPDRVDLKTAETAQLTGKRQSRSNSPKVPSQDALAGSIKIGGGNTLGSSVPTDHQEVEK